jgi:hypothetical protein
MLVDKALLQIKQALDYQASLVKSDWHFMTTEIVYYLQNGNLGLFIELLL